ncbi:MAG: ATP-binding protein [Clostridia bacterium]|nr:ATP-binding protein [Clostridia bacterium]
MKTIYREKYMDKIIRVMGTRDIKVLTGIRRSGKSKLLEAFRDYIESNIEDNNIIYINYALAKYEDLMEYHKLIDYVESKYLPAAKNFLLIDEVQMCDGFEKAINNFHAEEKYDIYITGSNAFLLSSDLATLFTGRTFSIEVYPFSFLEYQKYYNNAFSNIDDAFDKYFYDGGLSGSYDYDSRTEKYKYLNDIVNTSIIRDIKTKYKVRSVKTLENITDFLMQTISNQISPNKITNKLVSSGDSITNKTTSKYIDYLCNAFLFYRINRYDVKGKKILESLNKYYLCDHAFKYAKLGTVNMDVGYTYENIVAIELLRRGYELYTGNLYNGEIDFVAKKRDETLYIQVSDDIKDEKTYEREIKPLLQIKEGYKKIIIARTKQDTYISQGIEIYDIARWLCDDK